MIEEQSEEQKADVARIDSAQRREREDLRYVLSTVQGRRFVWQQMEVGKIFHSSFSTDALVMAFKEGSRATAGQLFERIVADHLDAYLAMMREQQEEQTHD